MSIRSPIFWLLFSILFVAYQHQVSRGSGREPKPWLWVLIASQIFLFIRDPIALLLLLGLTVLAFAVARRIESLSNSLTKRVWLFSMIGICVGVFVQSRADYWTFFGASFFTFQLLGYLIDVTWGRIPAERNFLVFFTSLSNFLYLTAGPILRTAEFRPQLEAPHPLTYADSVEAIFRIANGLAKKTAGDLLRYPVDAYFQNPGEQGLLAAWTAVLALAAQYYADFSGYSDIAIGLGSLLGLRLPENFKTPYLARSIIEHWKRSHITLGKWAHDYLFLPLTLSVNLARIQIGVGVLITMVFIGLWHGFTWNNLIWGGYNAVLILAAFQLGRVINIRLAGLRLIEIFATFYFILLGRVFLRTTGLGEVWAVWEDLHGVNASGTIYGQNLLVSCLVLMGLVLPHALDSLFLGRRNWFQDPRIAFPLTVLLLVFTLIFSTPGRPFLYESF